MNAMAAQGVCQGAHLHDIRAGLTGFLPTWDSAPGRLNYIDVTGVHGFVDYAHNAPGLRALGEFLQAYLEGLSKSNQDIGRRRLIGVVGTAGTAATATHRIGPGRRGFFDVIVLREDKKRRVASRAKWHHRSGDQRAEPRTNPGNTSSSTRSRPPSMPCQWPTPATCWR